MGNSRLGQHRAASELLWDEAGIWAHDTFVVLNARYFDDAVPLRGVVWGLTPHGGRLGHTRVDPPWQGRITLHPALLDPHSDAWGMAQFLGVGYAREVLLHEMIHVLLVSRGGDHDHNTQAWCAEIMRLAPLLGLGSIKAAPVQPRRVDGTVVRKELPGHLSRDTLAHFPHSLRRLEWYAAQRERLPIPT